jgi:methylaspartate mutase sigma subunit
MHKKLVLGVIGADPHIVGNKLLEYTLAKADFEVINLGAMVEPNEFIEAAIETDADAILIGSLSGFGEVYARDFRERCEESGLKDILLYMGGNIVMGKRDWSEVEKEFHEMGFNRVYPPRVSPDKVIKDLNTDFSRI